MSNLSILFSVFVLDITFQLIFAYLRHSYVRKTENTYLYEWENGNFCRIIPIYHIDINLNKT